MPELDTAAQREILGEVASRVAASFSPGVTQATVWSVMVSSEVRKHYTTMDESGESTRRKPPDGVTDALRRLRSRMYGSEFGTWFAVELTVTPDARYTVTFHYDTEPAESLLPEQWLNELKHFPRERQYIPQWWQERIRQAPNVYGVIRGVTCPDVFASFFASRDWQTETQWGGESRVSNDWAYLRTLSKPQFVRFAGRVAPERIGEFEALLRQSGWDFEGEFLDADGRTARSLATTPVQAH